MHYQLGYASLGSSSFQQSVQKLDPVFIILVLRQFVIEDSIALKISGQIRNSLFANIGKWLETQSKYFLNSEKAAFDITAIELIDRPDCHNWLRLVLYLFL